MGAAPAVLPDFREWRIPRTRLNQGQHGYCVGYGWENWRRSEPERDRDSRPAQKAVSIYTESRGYAGLADYPSEGSTVHGGAEVVKAHGWSNAETAWEQDINAATEYILGTGDVVVGFNWYAGMFNPDAQGVVRVAGSIAGGHCWHVYGANRTTGMWLCENSWGYDWAKRGLFLVPMETVDRLLREDGECAAVLESRPHVAVDNQGDRRL
jgi:hypothetical protein